MRNSKIQWRRKRMGADEVGTRKDGVNIRGDIKFEG